MEKSADRVVISLVILDSPHHQHPPLTAFSSPSLFLFFPKAEPSYVLESGPPPTAAGILSQALIALDLAIQVPSRVLQH